MEKSVKTHRFKNGRQATNPLLKTISTKIDDV